MTATMVTTISPLCDLNRRNNHNGDPFSFTKTNWASVAGDVEVLSKLGDRVIMLSGVLMVS